MNDDRECLRQCPEQTAVLRVYVAEHCGACRESRRLAKVIGRRLPTIAVKVIDVDHHEPVDKIFAVPTFCFREKIVSLGNPQEEELIDRVLSLDREYALSNVACTTDQRSNATFPATDPQPEIEAVVVSHREISGRTFLRIAPWFGALGLVYTLLCSLTMVAPAPGLITPQGMRSSMAGMSNSRVAGQAQIPGWWIGIMHLGPPILVLSVCLVVLAVSVRRPPASMPAVVGGLSCFSECTRSLAWPP
ncbi:MAG: hypothetical protein NVS2B16_26160 [Chloroflexota bacterium]